ncbi:unnamed protein product [Rangifer tarandus platyrhynchus]|uniref:Uncharacterized protein n=1 Tax=Rangifer tarandus platyrhynchus TaxID=3082113 RepID=A0AC59YKK5_RANTA
MSVDPERHTLTHTHSHARTHAGPSAAPPAPPRTFTPSAVPSDPAPGAQPLPTLRTNRTGSTEMAGNPHHPAAAVPASPRPPGGGEEGERCPGLLPLRRPSARGSAAGSRPATSAGPAGTRPEGGPEPRGPSPAPSAAEVRAPPHPGCPGRGAGFPPHFRPTIGNLVFPNFVPPGELEGRPPPPGADLRALRLLPLKAPRKLRS